MDTNRPIPADDKEAYASTVDPFLVEALQNPRHRLTILRMELDIQKFLKNSDQQQFEFQHFPTSYLRLAAHRVAQHYGLLTTVHDNGVDGLSNRIVVKKLADIRYPAVCLSEIPAKQLENHRHEHVKIITRSKPNSNKTSLIESNETGTKHSPMRTVEERKEDYDRARARIFSGPCTSELDNCMSLSPTEWKNIHLSGDKVEGCKNLIIDLDKNLSIRDGGTSSRVAIFRDREKDLTDPDYDRSYERYVKNIPTDQGFNLLPCDVQKLQAPFMQHDMAFPQLGQAPGMPTSLNYRTPIMSPFSPTGLNQTSGNAIYMQWPTSTMMYAQSYDQFRHSFFQAPYCQRPLSFDYYQKQ
ncbi:hypothetical protein NMG60_11031072 [Bertholletia excelsa]